ncbi:heavy metal translocating P-type ATPase [Empedobacter brevis]|uniref:heavy metal translocating P-type ATPase n=1 Tax=Empedobacter brevis TaxID=247 RepID=UPI002FE340B0
MSKYICPMHPQVIKDKPGNCPLCGMRLVALGNEQKTEAHYEHHNHSEDEHHHGEENKNSHVHDKHEGHHTYDFIKRFWISLIVTIPILLLSEMIQHWLGFSIHFAGDKWILLLLSTFIFIYGGMPFFKGMVGEIKAKAIGMMTLVALAISVAYLYSVAVVFGLKGMDFFWELATLIDIMLLGHWLEMRSQMSASKALQSLVALLPSTVTVERNGSYTEIPLEDLQHGENVMIRPGEKIPVDGVVSEGKSSVDESMLTGESVPVQKNIDEKVIAGSINGDGMLKVEALGIGKDSYLNKVIDLVQSAQQVKSNTQNLADKVAKWLTYIALIAGVSTFIYWYITSQDIAFALERMVTVMVTACPHALGVAIPLVVAISTTQSATNGLLIRNRKAFEQARNLTTIIFDKTGTLTEGAHAVQQIIPLTDKYTANELLQNVAAVQQNSEHHIAKGILRKLREEKLPLLLSTNFEYMQGMGVKGEVEGKEVIAAGPNYFIQKEIKIPNTPSSIDVNTETISYVLINNEVVGVISMADTIRETSYQAIEELKNMGIKTYLLTGDNEKIASSVANKLKMDGYFANVLPHEKLETIKEFQQEGELVAMTGDGVNDAPALAQADIGIAIGSGTDVAAETADIILVNSDPLDVSKLINFGKKTYNKMIQNLFWAVGYNVITIPLAAGVLYPHFMLSPALGAVLMSLSTIIVAINGSLLKLNK